MFIEFEIKQKDNKFFSKTLDFGFGFHARFVPELTGGPYRQMPLATVVENT
jgi:hypothetical protein